MFESFYTNNFRFWSELRILNVNTKNLEISYKMYYKYVVLQK